MTVNKKVFEDCRSFVFTPAQKDWITSLRRGRYKQAKDHLHTPEGFCCLGVGVMRAKKAGRKVRFDVFNKLAGSDLSSQPNVQAYLGLRGTTGQCIKPYLFRGKVHTDDLTKLNDDLDASFKEIADVLEQNPEAFFVCNSGDLALAYARDLLPIAEEMDKLSEGLKSILQFVEEVPYTFKALEEFDKSRDEVIFLSEGGLDDTPD